jgi:hypothetical protein
MAIAIVEEVVKAQCIHGIKETNKLFQKAEDRDYLDELTKQVYENQLFEEFTHRLCTKLLKQENLRGFEHFVINQGHCLQSDDPQIRLKAASIILDINENVLNALDSYDSRLLSIAKAISDCDFNLSTDFYYKSLVYEYLKEIVDNLRMASDLVSRDGVSKHLADYLKKLSKDLDFLSPGLSWKQIQAIAETKRQEEEAKKQKLAMLRRQEEAAEEKKQKLAMLSRQQQQEAKRRAEKEADQEREEAAEQRQRLAREAKNTVENITTGLAGCLSIACMCGVVILPLWAFQSCVNWGASKRPEVIAEENAYAKAQAIEKAKPGCRITGYAGVGHNELYMYPKRDSNYIEVHLVDEVRIIKILSKSRDKKGTLWYKIDLGNLRLKRGFNWINSECVTCRK